MSEINQRQLYPNATLQGDPIPFDVLLSFGCTKIAFTSSPVDAVAIPASAQILVIYADDEEACYIRFDDTAFEATDGTFVAGQHYIPKASVVCLDPNGASTYGVVSATGNSGTVRVEAAAKWQDTRKAKQFERT